MKNGDCERNTIKLNKIKQNGKKANNAQFALASV